MTDCAWNNPNEDMQALQRSRRGRINKLEGEAFERIIETACRWYREQGTAEIEKTPEPIKQLGAKNRNGQFKACYQKRAQPDFKGTIDGGMSVVFEAKHTESDRIAQSVISQEQWDRLEAHNRLGADAFVLVALRLEDFYRVPWTTWRNMKTIYGYKHMKKEDLEEFRISNKNGILRFLEAPEDCES